jgi:hypothetical protein
LDDLQCTPARRDAEADDPSRTPRAFPRLIVESLPHLEIADVSRSHLDDGVHAESKFSLHSGNVIAGSDISGAGGDKPRPTQVEVVGE